MLSTQAKQDIVKNIEEFICITDILDDILMTIQENAQPEDVFEKEQLETWAENNGYVKAD